MFAAITIIILIWISMWIFYKFMYPRAPKSMMPQDGDVTTLRHCNFCGHSLAEYRGVLEISTPIESKPVDSANAITLSENNAAQSHELFFCNYEHQADFHAGKSYQ